MNWSQGDADNTALRTVPWQQTLLFILVAGLFSGEFIMSDWI